MFFQIISRLLCLTHKLWLTADAKRVVNSLLRPADMNPRFYFNFTQRLRLPLVVLNIPTQRLPEKIQKVGAELHLVISLVFQEGSTLAERLHEGMEFLLKGFKRCWSCVVHIGSSRPCLLQSSAVAIVQIGRACVGKECRSRWSPYH